jgi:SOS regulatory protein LexA
MLTKRQKEVLDFIKGYAKKKGYAPSLEEIRRGFRLASVSTAHFHISRLQAMGYLEKEENRARAIDIPNREQMIQVPILGTIAAGRPIEAIENREETISVAKNKLPRSGEFYALRVEGESMIDENINDGDVVIVLNQSTVENGEKAVALINSNEVTLKKVYWEKDKVRLQPANSRLSPIYVDPDELTIQGKVVMTVRTMERVQDIPSFKTSLIPRGASDISQNALFDIPQLPKFPSTRFQGSKAKLTEKIWERIKDIKFETVLDLFGGTGAVGYMLKTKGKQVVYNDYLYFNYLSGLAIIENPKTKLSEEDVDFILSIHSNIEYPDFIQKTFKDIYFTDQENKWLDIVSTNIRQIKDVYKQAIAYFALFQACTIKRPYNLFHRKNLYVRLANVERSFGNKTTWDKPFGDHFMSFVKEANEAVFDNGKVNKALNEDVFNLDTKADLIYIDTPYISQKGVGVDYINFYHFLEGLSDYQNWYKYVDYSSKHRKFKNKKSEWSDKKLITEAFDRLFRKFKDSILVVSYRSDGIPSPEYLAKLMSKYKKNVCEAFRSDYKYALSKNGDSKEILLIGE